MINSNSILGGKRDSQDRKAAAKRKNPHVRQHRRSRCRSVRMYRCARYHSPRSNGVDPHWALRALFMHAAVLPPSVGLLLPIRWAWSTVIIAGRSWCRCIIIPISRNRLSRMSALRKWCLRPFIRLHFARWMLWMIPSAARAALALPELNKISKNLNI